MVPVVRRWAHLFSSLRFRLLLLVLLAVLPALGLTLATGLERRREAAAEVKREVERITRLAANNEEELIEGSRQFLIALAQVVEVSYTAPAECSAFLQHLMTHYPNYTTLSVARTTGEIYCSSRVLEDPVSVSDRDYFSRVLSQRDFVIGDYTFGRISEKAILPFAYPVLDDAGQIQAVLIASLDLGWLNRLAMEIELPEKSVLRVIDSQGTILAHFPDPETWLGRTLPEDDLLQEIRRQGGSGSAELPGPDGVKRLYAYTPLGGVNENMKYLSVGVPLEVAYAEANRSLLRNLIALGLVAVVVMAAAWVTGDVFILRQVNMLVAATRRLAKGDLGSRSGLAHDRAELGQLAAAFDQMAQTLQEREAQLIRSNRELQDFAFIASHDLQEPLRKIQAFGERLITKHGQALSQEGQEYVARMVKDAARMQTMINDLLAYSRVSTRTQPFTLVALSSVAAEAVSDLQVRLEETGGKVILQSLPVVEGDAFQLRQLFVNLIGNAIKFHKPGLPPLVRVYCGAAGISAHPSLSTADSFVEVVVEDNGIGFEEKYLDRIFEPFQRLHGRSAYEGSGIGLSICRKIGERHGGKITANSRLGAGAAFIVTLPVRQLAKRSEA